MIKASNATVEDMIILPNGKKVVVINVLDVPAVYGGYDEYFDYWIGTDGTIYGVA